MEGNWQDTEIRELLQIRAEEEIRFEISGTVRDSLVYAKIAQMLAGRGIWRSKKQVQSKLKCLKRQYLTIKEENDSFRSRNWPFVQLCSNIWGNAAADQMSISSSNMQESRQPNCRSLTTSPVHPDSEPALSVEDILKVEAEWALEDVSGAQPPQSQPKESACTSRAFKRKRSRLLYRNVPASSLHLSPMLDERPTMMPHHPEDDCDIFGKFVASELRQMENSQMRKLARLQIQQVLLDVQLDAAQSE